MEEEVAMDPPSQPAVKTEADQFTANLPQSGGKSALWSAHQ